MAACLAGCQLLEQASPLAPNPPALYEAAKMERLTPVFTTGEFTYQAWSQPPRVYDYAEFVSGNKQVAVRVVGDVKRPTDDHRVFVNVNGKELISFSWWGAFSGPHGGFGYPFPDYQDDKGKLSIDKANGRISFVKPYQLPDGKVSQFSYTVAQNQEGNVEIAWDLGITEEQLKSYKGVFRGVQLWMGFKNGTAFFGGAKYAETFRAWEKAHPTEGHVPVSGDFELHPDGVADAAVKVSLGGRGGSVEGGLFRMSSPPLAKDKVIVDLGKSQVAKITPPPPTNGMDFWKLDALHVPDFPTRNIMPNPSFEQGLRYWFWTDGGAAEFKPDESEMKYDVVPGGKFGKHALIQRTIQPRTAGIKSFPLALKSGTTYTLSLYARAPDAKAPLSFSVGLSSVSTGGKFTSPQQHGNFFGDHYKPEAKFRVGKDWTRLSRTFVADGAGIHLQLGGCDADIMIDGIQLEEGDKPTDFVCSPVEGNLVASDPDCQVAKGMPLAAGYVLSGNPGTEGRLDVTVGNAYRETVYSGSFAVKLGLDGEQTIELPLDSKRLDEGIFVVRADFDIAGFRPYVQYSRLTVMAPLANQHDTRCVVGTHANYGQISRSESYARRMMEWGFGSSSWGKSGANERLRQKYGVTSFLYGYPPSPKAAFMKDLPNWKEVTPEMEKIIEEDAYEFVKAQDPKAAFSFALSNEEEGSSLPGSGRFDEYCKAQYAFYKGVKRANPKALVTPSNGTSGYSVLRGFEPMEGYLKAANKAGFKYDAVSVHPYWDIDKGTLSAYDLDEETARLVEQMKRNGYSDATPIFFTEMFNAPWVKIPEWGAGDWADSYRKAGSPTYALGNREFIHAASAARIWIICLKYWPKVQSANLWVDPRIDLNLTPILMCKAANTIGHLMPWVQYHADARPARGIRGYVFQLKDGTAIAPVWCINNDVENGLKAGPVIDVTFGQDVAAYDLMGARRSLPPGPDGVTRVPLTPAPLFITAKDVASLAKALQSATTDDAGSSLAVAMAPAPDGNVVATVKNLTGKEQAGTLSIERTKIEYDIAPAAEKRIGIPGANQGREFGKMYRWNNDFSIQPAKGPLYESQWEMDYFFVPKCAGMPDWNKIPAIPMLNRHLGKGIKAGYKGDLEASFKVAWDNENLYLHVEAEDDEFLTFPEAWQKGGSETCLYAHDGCLEVYFDCGANGRSNLSKTYDNDDYRYDFSLGKDGKSGPGMVYRLREVNWQFAGGANMPTKEQAAKGIGCDFQRTAKGYAYTIVFAQKHLEPIVLREGFVAGFALYLHDKDHQDGKVVWKGLDTATEPGSHCDYKPHVWPLMILKDP
jgi:hypothetical protein